MTITDMALVIIVPSVLLLALVVWIGAPIGWGASAMGETLGREHRRPPTQSQSAVTQ